MSEPEKTTEPGEHDAYLHGGQERLESKLRLFVLRRHIKEAEVGVLDRVIRELGMMALAKKPDGTDLEIEPRTQQQAMATYLRNVEKAARMGTPSVTIDQSVHVDTLHALLIQATKERKELEALDSGSKRKPRPKRLRNGRAK